MTAAFGHPLKFNFLSAWLQYYLIKAVEDSYENNKLNDIYIVEIRAPN